MQALIDYDGWRKWKDINKNTDSQQKDKKGAKVPSASMTPVKKRGDKGRRGSMNAAVNAEGSGTSGSEGFEGGEVAVGA